MEQEPLAVQRPDGHVDHRYETVMLTLAVLVVPVVLLDDAEPHGTGHVVAVTANWIIWVAFAAELALMLAAARRRRAALRSHWLEAGIVLASFPLLPGLFAVARLARLARLLRLLRLGLFGTRALRAERRLSSGQGFRLAAVITLVLTMSAGFAISLVDTHDFPNAWSGGRSSPSPPSPAGSSARS